MEYPKATGFELVWNYTKFALWVIWFIAFVVLALAAIFGDTSGWWALAWLVGASLLYWLYSIFEFYLLRRLERRRP